jgi:YidC/Oxa1 family membrane protein insertase
MADTLNDGAKTPQPPQEPKKELSMEMRLLLAFLLMGAVLFTTPYFYKFINPPQPPKKTLATGKTPASQAGRPPAAATPAAAVAAAPATAKAVTPVKGKKAAAEAPDPNTPQIPQAPLLIETEQYRLAISNHGATVRSWVLKHYKGNDDRPLELINTSAGGEFPFSLYFPGQKPPSNINWAYYAQTVDPDGRGVTFRYFDGHTAVKKIFRFQKSGYESQISTEVTIDGKPVPALVQWRGGFGDLTIASPSTTQRAIYFNVPDNKFVEETVKVAKNGPAVANGNYSFAGISDSFFAAVFLPVSSATMETVTFDDGAPTPQDKTAQQMVGMAVGAGTDNKLTLFVGPKDLQILRKVNPKLEQVVDFGWLSFLAKPLFLIVSWFNASFIHNYGWAIVVVTIIINFVLFPLKLSNMKSMRKMQALQPQIAAINDKYKSIGMRDPRKADQNQEVMALYKKYGVNPAGGCVPMLLQIPFFFAFYKVFTVSVEMRGASWLWVGDLSQPEHLAIKILPIAMIASQFVMQKMTPQANVDPNQQKMMMFMPLIFGFMFYNFPSGLVLYYLTSNLVSMGQQWFFNHTAAAEEAARSVEVKKKIGRK